MLVCHARSRGFEPRFPRPILQLFPARPILSSLEAADPGVAKKTLLLSSVSPHPPRLLWVASHREWVEICLPPLLITKDFVAPSGEEKVDLYESEVRNLNQQETSHLTFDVPFDDSAASFRPLRMSSYSYEF